MKGYGMSSKSLSGPFLLAFRLNARSHQCCGQGCALNWGRAREKLNGGGESSFFFCRLSGLYRRGGEWAGIASIILCPVLGDAFFVWFPLCVPWLMGQF